MLLVTAAAAGAQPHSAIPWLSESIRVENRPPPPRPGGATAPPVRGTEEITVTRLGAISRDVAGLLAPEVTGLPRDLWGPTPAGEVAALILAHPEPEVPAARALFRTILLAEADPPPGASRGNAPSPVLLARVDRLLAMGALKDAKALIERAGPDAPELYRRWFDVGILTNDADPACAALRQNPALSPTLPARVFCLARGGDWNAAEITLTLGEEVGAIAPDQQPLLARFLDPELFEGEPAPAIPEPLTPLEFLMREAVALPRPSGPLPVAFLHHDLADHAPVRSRIEAAERLVLSGGVEPDVLFAAYRAGEPAASGGVWDRAAAVQALDVALASGDAAEAGARLAEAETLLGQRRLAVALAEAYGAAIAELDPARLGTAGRAAAFRLLLLAGDAAAAARAAPRPLEPRAATLLAVAGAPATAQPDGDLERAAAAGTARPATRTAIARLRLLLDEGRHGEALLKALEPVAAAGTPDPGALREALLVLRLTGQEAAARAIAVQSLLLGGTG